MDLAGKVDLVIGDLVTGVRKEQTQILRLPDAQVQLSIVKLLAGLAEARQASVSDKTFRMYARHLAEFEYADVQEAVRQLARMGRADGETAFPAMGQIIDKVFAIRKIRVRDMAIKLLRDQDEADFWNWVARRIGDTGQTEQQILDSVTAPGYTGRKARAA